MGPFIISYDNTYIFVIVDYASKWVEAVALLNNKGKNVMAFLNKHIFFSIWYPQGHH